ncbi:MAG TPA: hypothetical protein VFV99_16435, partial [Kofleriaceae bacterium]|nr:hypothetical protein [Kofleriaceae bacterium]
PAGYQAGGVSPHAAANAATMFASGPPPGAQPSPPAPQYGGGPAPGYGAPSPGYGNPAPGYGAPAPAYQPPPSSAGMGIHSPQQATPAPLPAVHQPYLGAQTGGVAHAGRPVEPWKDPLKLWMFVWGAIALAAFATPVMTDPMAFQWDAIIHGEGKMKIPGLVWASVGLLSIVFAAIPMSTLPRGALAAVLGIAGIFVPLAVTAFPPWQILVPMIGSLALVSGLLVRHEYVESLLARALVTVGVVCTLAPYLIPEHGQIPLVLIFKALLSGGNHMEIVIVALGQIVLVVLCLLAWMPGPATAGAKVFAWAVILYPILGFLLTLLGNGHIGDVISKQPGAMVAWAPGVAYSVLVGYGLATVIGKQLE